MAAIDNGKTSTIVMEDPQGPPPVGKENSPVKRKSETDSPGKKVLKGEIISGEVVAADERVEEKLGEKTVATDGDATDAKIESDSSVPIPNDISKSEDVITPNGKPKADVVEPKSDASSDAPVEAAAEAGADEVKSDGAAETTKDAKQEEQPSVVADAEATA